MPTSDQPAPAIDCEKCGAPMKLLGSLPRLGVYPELRTYKCDACRRVETTVAEWPRTRPPIRPPRLPILDLGQSGAAASG